jgi:GTPase SAR1 family protein
MSGFRRMLLASSGFTQRHVVRLDGSVREMAWSRDGHLLAVAWGESVSVIHARTGEVVRAQGGSSPVTILAWSPDANYLLTVGEEGGAHLWTPSAKVAYRRSVKESQSVTAATWDARRPLLALGHSDGTVRIWDGESGVLRKIHRPRHGTVACLAWSHDGFLMASATEGSDILIWAVNSGALKMKLVGHERRVETMAWSRDGRRLLSGSRDGTVRLWDTTDGRTTHILEGHSAMVEQAGFFADEEVLISRSSDGVTRLWEVQTMNAIAEEETLKPVVAFNPGTPLFASCRADDQSAVTIWEVDANTVLGRGTTLENIHYRNAKVVLVGDTGAGKSGLSLVLSGHPFAPTESTHGRHVWTLCREDIVDADGGRETHELLLWDLAGQPGYRIIHQLHLNDIEVALICFDARSETDPFSGVHHWAKALRLAETLQGSGRPLRKFLVAARTDRGGVPVPRERIDAMIERLGLDGYFATSAKELTGVPQLLEKVRSSIEWERLPKVTSTALFEDMKSYLLGQKSSGQVLVKLDELWDGFAALHKNRAKGDGRRDFDTCIGRLEARGLVRRLSFGSFVLLQPEMIDSYASAIVNAAKEEPDGLGSISEEIVLTAKFGMPETERIANRTLERVLLLTTVQELLRHEIVIREQADGRTDLIFPSQLTRENPEMPEPAGRALTLLFEGPVLNIYATLVVRLSHSGTFRKADMWKNSVLFATSEGYSCGIFIRELEGSGELTIYFGDGTPTETRQQFEEFVRDHVAERAVAESLFVRRAFACSSCGEVITDSQVRKRLQLKQESINCPVCDTSVSLEAHDSISRANEAPLALMNMAAEQQRIEATTLAIIEGKRLTSDFDVFLCHNSNDKARVKHIGRQLMTAGVLPWLDEWELRPGIEWYEALEQQIDRIRAAAVFVGEEGLGPWQRQEVAAFLREFLRRRVPVIPVLLDTGPKEPPKLPVFLQGLTWVDFRNDRKPLQRLIWGITGERPVE